VGLCRSVGIPARDIYGVRVADSKYGYKSLGKSGDITKAQHCRADFYAQGRGWVPVDPADVRKVVSRSRPESSPIDDPKVKAARERLFGSWEMNWLAYNWGHDLALPGAQRGPVGFLMYPQCETSEGTPRLPRPGQLQVPDGHPRTLTCLISRRGAARSSRPGSRWRRC
jgi:transglutaminase-like putative cysteine protease